MYPDDAAWVHIIAINLDESTSEWLVSLHDDDAPELVNLNAFMQALWEQFKDPMGARFLLPGQPLGRLA